MKWNRKENISVSHTVRVKIICELCVCDIAETCINIQVQTRVMG